MLVMRQEHNEQIRVETPGGPMVISVKRNAHGHIKIGVDAPRDWQITREARGTPRVPKGPGKPALPAGVKP
ncbi:MAG: carbon storage regulator [Phycisphaerales bacterium]|nr:carbon storage regulator [Phycisphaerales bacterium]